MAGQGSTNQGASDRHGALKGVRVLDFGRFIAGPACAAMLGDLGADVIRVDKRGGSEDRFTVPITSNGEGTTFIQNNRNKRSIELDPTTPEGKDVVRRLVDWADVVIANNPPATLRQMGIDYETLSAIKPEIIYLMSTAFGSSGPYANRVGFDGVGQVMSGAAYRSGEPGKPMRAGVPYIDHSTALCGTIAVLAAIVHRDRTGEGQLVESSLLGTALLMGSSLIMEQAATKADRLPQGNRSPLASPADIFQCLDGAILVQAAGNPMYRRWAKLMGEEIWLTDPRFATDASRGEHGEMISERMQRWCETGTKQEALDILELSRIAAYPVYSPQDALDDPHIQLFLRDVPYAGLEAPAKAVETPFRMSKTPPTWRTAPPILGEHTQEVLGELGYAAEQITALRTAGAI